MRALSEKKFFLLDMDGTIYLDNDLSIFSLPIIHQRV